MTTASHSNPHVTSMSYLTDVLPKSGYPQIKQLLPYIPLEAARLDYIEFYTLLAKLPRTQSAARWTEDERMVLFEALHPERVARVRLCIVGGSDPIQTWDVGKMGTTRFILDRVIHTIVPRARVSNGRFAMGLAVAWFQRQTEQIVKCDMDNLAVHASNFVHLYTTNMDGGMTKLDPMFPLCHVPNLVGNCDAVDFTLVFQPHCFLERVSNSLEGAIEFVGKQKTVAVFVRRYKVCIRIPRSLSQTESINMFLQHGESVAQFSKRLISRLKAMDIDTRGVVDVKLTFYNHNRSEMISPAPSTVFTNDILQYISRHAMDLQFEFIRC